MGAPDAYGDLSEVLLADNNHEDREQSNSPSQSESNISKEIFKEYTLNGLNGHNVSKLVDIIIEIAGTNNSSTQLDKVIEESRQISLNQADYKNVQKLIVSIRKKLNAIRTEQEENKPKKAIELRAEARRRSKNGYTYTRVIYDMPSID